jgi:hypothetical protein
MTAGKGRQLYYRCLFTILGWLLCATAVVRLLPTALVLPPAYAQSQESQPNQLKEPEAIPMQDDDHGSVEIEQKLFSRPLKIDERLEQLPEEDIQKRPFLHFRRAMNRPPQIGKCCFVLTMFGLIVLLLRRSDVFQAKDVCRKKFFRSFLTGFITMLSLMLLARPLFLSEIGMPLGLAFIALLQLGLSLGLVVSTSLIGEWVADLGAVNRIAWLVERPAFQSIVHLVLGVLLVGAILLIPGIGHLPRIGTRIVVLIGIAGMGALMKSKFGQCSNEKK